jgi:hypothetical protein
MPMITPILDLNADYEKIQDKYNMINEIDNEKFKNEALEDEKEDTKIQRERFLKIYKEDTETLKTTDENSTTVDGSIKFKEVIEDDESESAVLIMPGEAAPSHSKPLI